MSLYNLLMVRQRDKCYCCMLLLWYCRMSRLAAYTLWISWFWYPWHLYGLSCQMLELWWPRGSQNTSRRCCSIYHSAEHLKLRQTRLASSWQQRCEYMSSICIDVPLSSTSVSFYDSFLHSLLLPSKYSFCLCPLFYLCILQCVPSLCFTTNHHNIFTLFIFDSLKETMLRFIPVFTAVVFVLSYLV